MAGESLLTLEELVTPLPLDRFIAEYWGKKPFVTAVSDDMLEYIRTRFCNGEIGEVLQACRKDDNTAFTNEEVEKMESDFQDHRATLNLPFCFCEGADDLRSSFIEACSGLGNDVEVGVYFSQTGGEATAWHFDNNHNITLQLQGEKDWRHAPGDVNTVASRSLADLARRPKNRHEQQRPVPPTGLADVACSNLRPGSVIYLPPGHWHAVSSVGADSSFSVDLRVGNVHQGKWIAEALFAGLLERFTNGECSSRGVQPADLTDTPSQSFTEQASFAMQNFEPMLQRCKMLRAFPFEVEHSNGLHKGATLDFLCEKKFMAPKGLEENNPTVGLNALVAMSLKLRDRDCLIVQLYSESTLSTMEYLHFSLVCDVDLHGACALLAKQGRAEVSSLHEACTKPRQLSRLLRVLLHANVLYAEPGAPAAGEEPAAAVEEGAGSQPGSKRKRRKRVA